MTGPENEELSKKLLSFLLLLSSDFLNEHAQKVIEYLLRNFDVIYLSKDPYLWRGLSVCVLFGLPPPSSVCETSSECEPEAIQTFRLFGDFRHSRTLLLQRIVSQTDPVWCVDPRTAQQVSAGLFPTVRKKQWHRVRADPDLELELPHLVQHCSVDRPSQPQGAQWELVTEGDLVRYFHAEEKTHQRFVRVHGSHLETGRHQTRSNLTYSRLWTPSVRTSWRSWWTRNRRARSNTSSYLWTNSSGRRNSK